MISDDLSALRFERFMESLLRWRAFRGSRGADLRRAEVPLLLTAHVVSIVR
jgi:hypothetical protein